MADEPNKLDDEVKAHIVQGLACFDTPSQVATSVKAVYGLVVSPQQVEAYDPNKRAGKRLSEKWKTIFEAARKAFIDDASAIPIAHRSTRLRALWRMATVAETKGNLALAANLHKQAAEEMGNAYTNRRELTGKDGKDLPAAQPAVAVFALPDNGRG
jgi:hypothetical protein